MVQEIRVNWAYQSNTTSKEDTSGHFHIFVGDLSNEVNDEVLLQAFSVFGTISEARVMWDMKTGRSRGYGFVAFRDRADAEKALSSMDGEWLGSRAIRCNWANQKGQPSIAQQQAMAAMGMTPTTPYGHHHFPTHGIQSYDMIVGQTPAWQTTCYVGNLTPYTTQNDLVPLFSNFGYVQESRMQADRGFAFIKMDSHENAAMAICQLNGYQVNGRPLKCSVSLAAGKDERTMLTETSGARTRHRTRRQVALTRLNRLIALRAPMHLVAIPTHLPPISPSMVVSETWRTYDFSY
jgi:nucleolysin TIA-1/TIAR